MTKTSKLMGDAAEFSELLAGIAEQKERSEALIAVAEGLESLWRIETQVQEIRGQRTRLTTEASITGLLTAADKRKAILETLGIEIAPQCSRITRAF
jgi:hypothetical protein